MLDPSLGAAASAFGGLGIASRDAGDLGGERMDHPAASISSCQTSVRSACRYAKLIAISVSPALSRLPGARECRLRFMKDADEAAGLPGTPPRGPLPDALATALAAFERHLRSERSLSPHTVRAYIGDVSSLLGYAAGEGIAAPEELGLAELRGWLAIEHESGAARTTLARRGAAARAFTAFAHRRGWLATDPGPQLGTLKTRRTLPHVLPQAEIASVLTGLDKAAGQAAAARLPPGAPGVPGVPGVQGAPGQRAETKAAVALRDSAVLELLYAT